MSRKITPEIYHLENTIFLVKVTSTEGCQDFCCTESREFANIIRDKLATHLVTEMKSDPGYSASRTQICQDNINETIVISTIALGTLWNGAKTQVYTISISAIPYGMVRLPPREETVKSVMVEENVPQYATFERVPEAIPRQVVVEIAPQPQTITAPTASTGPCVSSASTGTCVSSASIGTCVSSVPVPPPPPKIRIASTINKNSNANRRFNLERVIDELKISLQRIRIDNQL